MCRAVRLLLVAVVLAAVAGGAARAAPQADLWPRWQAHDPASTATIDHDAWGRFLDRYLARGDDGVNLVA